MKKTFKSKNKEQEKTMDINLLFSNTSKRLQMVFVANVSTVLIFGLIGYGLDKLFETKSVFLMSLILISFPVSIFVVIKKAENFTNNIKLKNNNG